MGKSFLVNGALKSSNKGAPSFHIRGNSFLVNEACNMCATS